MRKPVLLVAGALLLGGLHGCGGTQRDGDVVKAYLRDVAEVTAAYKLIRNDTQTHPPMATRPEDLKARIERDLEALKGLKDLPEDRLLEVQLRYGPALERLTMAHEAEFERLNGVFKKKGVLSTFIVGLEGVDNLFTSPDVTFLMDGYAPMSKRVVQDLKEAVDFYGSIKKVEQTEDAVPVLRRLRYRLAVDAVKLQHVEPARQKERDQLKAQLKTWLTEVVDLLKREQGRVQALGGAGPDAVSAMEPLPAQITALAS